jgi:hypothetical protein
MFNTTVYVAYNEQDKYIVSNDQIKLPIDEPTVEFLWDGFDTYSEAENHIEYMQKYDGSYKGCKPLAIKVTLEVVE